LKNTISEDVNTGTEFKWHFKNDLSVISIKNNNDNVNV